MYLDDSSFNQEEKSIRLFIWLLMALPYQMTFQTYIKGSWSRSTLPPKFVVFHQSS